MVKLQGEGLLAGLIATSALQGIAALFYLADGIGDWRAAAPGDGAGAIELLVAIALCAGVAVGIAIARHLVAETRRHREAVDMARGSVAQVADDRFARWGLTRSEAEVALFALKGFNAAEIADLRGSAPGTVRAQLSQVYGKAGVGSQSALVSSFIDELLEAPSPA